VVGVGADFRCRVVVVTAGFTGATSGVGVGATDTFHPQVVLTTKLYFPAKVDGLWPPSPSPVDWSS